MKKFKFFLVTAFLSLTFIPAQLRAGTETVSTSSSTNDKNEADAAKAKTLLGRLHDIDQMDKSKLSSQEKKGLKKEVRSIRKELKELQGGIYISVGVIILVLLLIIIL